jgi:hypothetical protein
MLSLQESYKSSINKKRLTYFSNCIAITLNLTNKGKKVNWCSIMLTQMSIELIWWIEHQKLVTIGLITPDRKAATCNSRLVIKVRLRYWFPLLEEDKPIDYPKPYPIQGNMRRKLLWNNLKKPLLRLWPNSSL